MECGPVRFTRNEAGGGLLSKVGRGRNGGGTPLVTPSDPKGHRGEGYKPNSACFLFGRAAAITAWARLM